MIAQSGRLGGTVTDSLVESPAHPASGASQKELRAASTSSLRAKRSNPESLRGDSLDCFVASLLATTGESDAYSSRSTLRRLGNSFIHNSATAIVPTPPRTAAGMAPNSPAVSPLSN